MAHIKPFKGITYNLSKIGDLKAVVAPPYDVISPTLQDYFYGLSHYNIIRLILGKDFKNDTARNNKYTRSYKFLNKWLKKKVLLKDKKPCFYIYRQIYLHKGKKCKRTGFFSLMKVEDPYKSNVLPHEYTLDKPKIDRLNLIKQVKSNLSPIFALYYDKKSSISKMLQNYIKENTSVANIDLEGVTHQLWKVFNAKTITRIKHAMRKKRVVIADGHHRYEVALTYRNLMRRKKNYNRNVNYVMMYFTNLKETGNVTILSTHRLLRDIGALDKKTLKERVEPFFDISNFKNLGTMLKTLEQDNMQPRFGIYLKDEGYLLISLKKKVNVSKIIESNRSLQWKRLDVIVLHNFVIKDLLCLKDCEDNVKYVREPEHVVRLVNAGSYNIAFFLNPTKAKQVREVAERGDIMPQKSTYFYPKLLTGLVINKF